VALLLRREQGCKAPERLWEEGEVAPLDGIIIINEMHRNSQITFKEWLRYVREWTENVAEHYGIEADIEQQRRIPKH